jgi:DNA-binding response OmpR family regulator
LKVLFVDDDKATTDSLAAIAEALGHDASKAYSSAAALLLARGTQFDLILLDVQLGDGDGRTICTQLRDHGQSRNAHIVAVTGHVGLEKELSLGDFNGYIVKPIEFEQLEDLLMS